MGRWVLLFCAVFVWAGCAPLGPQTRTPTRPTKGFPAALVQEAHRIESNKPRYVFGRSDDKAVDCSGFMKAIFRNTAGYNIMEGGDGNGVRRIFMWCQRNRIAVRVRNPKAGDLVFFDQTYDGNRDGRVNSRDALTHVGMVYEVPGDGTFRMIHAAGRGKGIRRGTLKIHKRPGTGWGILRGFATVPAPR